MAQEKARVRLATKEDIPAITRVQVRAFGRDAVYNWMQGLGEFLEPISNDTSVPITHSKARKREAFCRALTVACFRKGRVDVVECAGEIVAIALWLPPKSRVHITDVVTMVRSGFL